MSNPRGLTILLLVTSSSFLLACGGVSNFDGNSDGDADVWDDTDATDGTDVPDGTDGMDGTDGTDVPDGLDAPDGTDGTDTTDGVDTVDAPPACGDGTLDPGEGCDDGNNRDGDGCSAGCVIEASPTCGDGNVDYAEWEECDDGNTLDGDGCDSDCRLEAGPACGDGTLDIDQGEQCDDGGTASGDGCSSTCQFEPVGLTCGDGTPDPWEVCDDGGTLNGDNCNPTCNLTNTTETFVGLNGAQGLVDGVGTAARLGGYGTLAADDTYLYYLDASNHVIRRIEISTRNVQTIAGDVSGGTPTYLDDPVGLNARFLGGEAITTDGNTLWVADSRRIRAVSLTPPHAVTTVAGSGATGCADGFGTAATFDDLRGLTYYDGLVYSVDANAAVVRSFDPFTTEVVTVAGTAYATGTVDQFGAAARFISPRYMTSDNTGMLYIADTNGYRIRSYNTVTTFVDTFAGGGAAGYVDGIGTAALVHRPRGMASDGTSIYWVEFNQHTVRQGVLATASVTTLVGQHCGGLPCTGGYLEGVGTAALFNSPFSLAFHHPTGSLFVVDGGNFVIRRIF